MNNQMVPSESKEEIAEESGFSPLIDEDTQKYLVKRKESEQTKGFEDTEDFEYNFLGPITDSVREEHDNTHITNEHRTVLVNMISKQSSKMEPLSKPP